MRKEREEGREERRRGKEQEEETSWVLPLQVFYTHSNVFAGEDSNFQK